MLEYQEDNLSPDFNVGGTITFGPGGVQGSVTAGAGSPGQCINCAQGRALTFTLPIVLIVIAVLVLALRK